MNECPRTCRWHVSFVPVWNIGPERLEMCGWCNRCNRHSYSLTSATAISPEVSRQASSWLLLLCWLQCICSWLSSITYRTTERTSREEIKGTLSSLELADVIIRNVCCITSLGDYSMQGFWWTSFCCWQKLWGKQAEEQLRDCLLLKHLWGQRRCESQSHVRRSQCITYATCCQILPEQSSQEAFILLIKFGLGVHGRLSSILHMKSFKASKIWSEHVTNLYDTTWGAKCYKTMIVSTTPAVRHSAIAWVAGKWCKLYLDIPAILWSWSASCMRCLANAAERSSKVLYTSGRKGGA